MAFQRTAQRSLFLRPYTRFNNARPTLAISRYYAKDTASTPADGASDKNIEDAQPKILNRNPPAGEEQPKDVKEHNQNIDQRAEKPAGQAKEEDAKNDKVSKGFWGGEYLAR